MRPTELVTLTMGKPDRFKVIPAVVDGMLKPGRAAEHLPLSTCQMERLVNASRFWSDACLRETARMSRVDAVEGNGMAPDDQAPAHGFPASNAA
jgi:hypothetical protein